MAVRISTAKHPDDPSTGACAFQVTGLRFVQLFQENFEVQDGHGNVLGKGPVGVPHSEGDMCSFDTTVPGIPAATAYQIVVKLHGPVPGSVVTEAREPFTAEEARSGQVRMVVTGPASG
jgi:hypothetical protein